MLMLGLAVLFVAISAGVYYARKRKLSTPSLQWPVLAPILDMHYAADPPSLSGQWNGRSVRLAQLPDGIVASAPLSGTSRLRFEIGARELVAKRAGMIVPDPVPTGDAAFEERFLARCNDPAAGAAILEPVLRQRLLSFPHVDILGEKSVVLWRLPEARDPDTVEFVFDILTVIAAEMERFPA